MLTTSTTQDHPAAWTDTALSAALFAGFCAEELRRVTACLGVRVRPFTQGETLIRAGDPIASVGLVLHGSVYSSALTQDGSRNLVTTASAREVFGEELLGGGRAQLTVTGATTGEVLELGMGQILHPDGPLCTLRSAVVENLFHIMATKNRQLRAKVELLASKSLREKIMIFLREQQDLTSSRQFTVVFSRTELADYLNADRTALSRELARMRAAGLIDYHRNSFALLTL